MVYFCCVNGCKTKWYPGCGVSFHRIPMDESVAEKWKEIIPGKITRTSVMEASTAESSGSGSAVEYMAGVRLVVLNLPEDEGEGLGFRLTRTLWDPYPWVREITAGARADVAGLKTGDCLLQADGKDLLGLPIGQVAGLIRGDCSGHGVSLLVWNCGVDPKDDPELLWSCGGGARGERSRRALSGVVRALACCVCAATATRALSCARSHLYCEGCWSRLERCALCREPLPAKDSPYARNLVAEQVFEAIATEYEIKDTLKKPTESVSAYTSPNRSPNMSPSATRRGQYQLSMMSKKKTVQFSDKLGQSYGSDPNLHRSTNGEFTRRTPSYIKTNNSISQAGNMNTNGGKICNCQKDNQIIQNSDVPQIKVEDADKTNEDANCAINCQNIMMQHKIVARLRQACSLVDLQNSTAQTCSLSGSLNNIRLDDHCSASHSNSMDNLKNSNGCDSPVFVLSAPPIYLLACEHSK